MSRTSWLLCGVLLALILVGATAAVELSESARPGVPRPPARASSPAPMADVIRWIVAGGGPTPDSNQVSIEEDLALAVDVLGPGGRLLYAGGPDTRAVQVLDTARRGDALMAKLGHLFAPRPGRDSHYRETHLRPEGAATVEAFMTALVEGATTSGPDLLAWLAGHGEAGEVPQDNVVVFWGQGAVTPVDLARALDELAGPRRVRMVVTTCHSGGFSEFMFKGGDSVRGPSDDERCGLFATTWDRQASGCDPDPDRRRHEGYAVHFLHALRGQDRDGRPLPRTMIDFDGDGEITLLEAHGRVRIASAGVEVPTSTSERWLRIAAPTGVAAAPVEMPVEDAVIESLAAQLAVDPDVEHIGQRLEALETALVTLDQELAETQDRELERYDVVASRLLNRWPVLDDPWHPDFAVTLAVERAQIEAYLDRDDAYATFLDVSARVEQISNRIAGLERREARLLRLLRALENTALAGRLATQGGYAWGVYERLRSCEDSVP